MLERTYAIFYAPLGVVVFITLLSKLTEIKFQLQKFVLFSTISYCDMNQDFMMFFF